MERAEHQHAVAAPGLRQHLCQRLLDAAGQCCRGGHGTGQACLQLGSILPTRAIEPGQGPLAHHVLQGLHHAHCVLVLQRGVYRQGAPGHHFGLQCARQRDRKSSRRHSSHSP
ncbi:hypothetical protein G6F35_010407 [Rhizopus arrhizus]|nr:hypothetical protein G6F35_010407 [Rhizopus arrhizus]